MVIFLFIDVSYHAPCLHDDQKLDLIVVVDCATTNSAILGQLKTQLKYMVDVISRRSGHFRLAIISYQNHPYSGRRGQTASVSNIASVINFTDDKAKMKDNIRSLRCFGGNGSRRGLADGLALAVHLSGNSDDGDTYYKCRREALTVCVLLRKYMYIIMHIFSRMKTQKPIIILYLTVYMKQLSIF